MVFSLHSDVFTVGYHDHFSRVIRTGSLATCWQTGRPPPLQPRTLQAYAIRSERTTQNPRNGSTRAPAHPRGSSIF